MMKACETCLNISTPVCDQCRKITSPSGKETTPTHYVGDGVTPTNKLTVADVGAILLVRVQLGQPLPLSFVLRYNEDAVREK